MKAMRLLEYGGQLVFGDVPTPTIARDEEMASMFEWFERVGYSADIAGLEREFERTLTKLPDLARCP